jgi:hypothetical protein
MPGHLKVNYASLDVKQILCLFFLFVANLSEICLLFKRQLYEYFIYLIYSIDKAIIVVSNQRLKIT